MLNIKDLHASVEGKQILRGLNLEVKSGEVHAIMGPSGSGKSTLAQVLAGRDSYTVDSGSVAWRGRDLLALLDDVERLPDGKRALGAPFFGWLYALQPDLPIEQPYRAVSFSGSTSQAILLYYTPPGCVKLLDPVKDARLPHATAQHFPQSAGFLNKFL